MFMFRLQLLHTQMIQINMPKQLDTLTLLVYQRILIHTILLWLIMLLVSNCL